MKGLCICDRCVYIHVKGFLYACENVRAFG